MYCKVIPQATKYGFNFKDAHTHELKNKRGKVQEEKKKIENLCKTFGLVSTLPPCQHGGTAEARRHLLRIVNL